MRRLVLFTVLLVVLPLMASALADGPDPRAVVAKADQVARAINAVSYTADAWGEGAFQGQARIHATVKAKNAPDQPYPFLRLEGSVQARGSGESSPFLFVLNGKRLLSLDEQKKVAIVGEVPKDFDLIEGPMRSLLVAELLHPDPFSDVLSAKSLEYEGEKTVGDTTCYVIRVVYRQGHVIRWYFGTDDFLPHRVDRIQKRGDVEAAFVLTLSDLNPAPTFDESTFAIEVPEGYEQKEPLRLQRSDPRLLPVGSAAPDWTLKTPEGQAITLSKLRGKVVLLDFWATWCGPCAMAMPGLQKLHERFKDKPVVVYGIDTWEKSKRADPTSFVRRRGFTYGLLLEGDKVAKAYRVVGLPTTYVIGPDGRVLYAITGLYPNADAAIAGLIESILEPAPEKEAP